MRAFLSVVALASLVACRGGSAGDPPSPSGNAANARPAGVTDQMIALGDSLFNNGSCIRCHGAKGVGAQNGPALNDAVWVQLQTGAYPEIVQLVTTGVPAAAIKDPTRKNPMGARGGRMNLNDDQIRAVAAYVWSMSRK